jgi:glycosyltransferase involved in cell wall biosynthesis
MIVLQISSYDYLGGAGRIAWYLYKENKARGLESYLVAGVRTREDPGIFQFDYSKYQKIKIARKIRRFWDYIVGKENFNFPGTEEIPNLIPTKPDILHAHNLHGGYFDLRMLPLISSKFPTLLTLHDTWLLSGHCAYFINCERWKFGCGNCPDISRPPAIRRDASAYNWRKKKQIYEQSRFYVASPSQWLLDKVHESILMPAIIKSKVIHNGVDNAIFKFAEKLAIRRQLALPEDAFILLYVVAADMKKNAYKDFNTIDATLALLQSRVNTNRKLIFLGLGTDEKVEIHGNLEKRYIPYQKDLQLVAKYYQVSDIYIHAALADTFPNVVLEALACGTPVIATDVGGIREQVLDGRTGLLVPAQGVERMTQNIIELMFGEEKLTAMSQNAAEDALNRFSLAKMVDNYINYYNEISSTWKRINQKEF